MILVTGGNGLVGSTVVRQLLAQNQKVRLLLRPNCDLSLLKNELNRVEQIEGDVLDVCSLEKAIEGIEYVVHTAAVVSFSPKDRDKMYKVNVEGTVNVVNVCLGSAIKKIAFISSIAALGRPDPSRLTENVAVEIDEEQKWEDSPLNSHYAKTKYLAELEIWRGTAEGLPAVVVNPSVILGEGDWRRSSTQLFKYVYDEKPFYTNGTINYIDVLDVAKATVALLLSEIANERFILNAGHTTYKKLFEKMAVAFNKKAPSRLITPFWAEIIWRIEAVRSWFMGNAPLITKETAKTSKTNFVYKNQKIKNALNFEFQDLETTVRRVCGAINKL